MRNIDQATQRYRCDRREDQKTKLLRVVIREKTAHAGDNEEHKED